MNLLTNAMRAPQSREKQRRIFQKERLMRSEKISKKTPKKIE